MALPGYLHQKVGGGSAIARDHRASNQPFAAYHRDLDGAPTADTGDQRDHSAFGKDDLLDPVAGVEKVVSHMQFDRSQWGEESYLVTGESR